MRKSCGSRRQVRGDLRGPGRLCEERCPGRRDLKRDLLKSLACPLVINRESHWTSRCRYYGRQGRAPCEAGQRSQQFPGSMGGFDDAATASGPDCRGALSSRTWGSGRPRRLVTRSGSARLQGHRRVRARQPPDHLAGVQAGLRLDDHRLPQSRSGRLAAQLRAQPAAHVRLMASGRVRGADCLRRNVGPMAAVLTLLGIIIFFGLYLARIRVALARKSPYLFLAVVT